MRLDRETLLHRPGGVGFDCGRVTPGRIIDIRITGLPSAVSASDTSSSASLSVLGSARDDALTIGRAADGVLRVNGGAVPVAGGPATVASRRLM